MERHGPLQSVTKRHGDPWSPGSKQESSEQQGAPQSEMQHFRAPRSGAEGPEAAEHPEPQECCRVTHSAMERHRAPQSGRETHGAPRLRRKSGAARSAPEHSGARRSAATRNRATWSARSATDQLETRRARGSHGEAGERERAR